MRLVLSCLLFLVSATTLSANPRDALLDRYFAALKMDEVFSILHEEGIAAGEKIAVEDEAISQSPAWTARLEQIYASDKMAAVFRAAMSKVKEVEASEAALAFFEDPLGQKIIDIELEARRALSDEAIEDAARETVAEMRDTQTDRIALYEDFIKANDLIESNVMGALNSNLAFYRGMATSENFAEAMSENFMISTVWGQEPEIREEMEDWTINFSALAYSTLPAEEMQAYIDVSNTEAGQRLNAAMFAGFDAVFEMQSFELGRAMGEFMIGEDT